MQPSELLTTAQVAARCGRTVATVNRWAATGKLPAAHQLDGIRGARLFAAADVDTLAATITGQAS